MNSKGLFIWGILTSLAASGYLAFAIYQFNKADWGWFAFDCIAVPMLTVISGILLYKSGARDK